jgi:lactate dehydrogenase-like 2-hydroxyacid dehydrogenase
MSKKIYITRNIPNIAITMLTEKGYEVEVGASDDPLSKKQIIKVLKKKPYDAVICLLTDPIDADVFDSVPTAKLFANYATGFDNINLPHAKQRGVVVTNAPTDSSTEAVAQHSLALILALMTRIVEADDFVRKGKYKGWSPMNFVGSDISGKTLGLVGAGRIGLRLARLASAVGFSVIYTDVQRNEGFETQAKAQFYPSVESMLPFCDVVSLHVPLMDSTRHLINADALKLMKPSAFLVNTSRGPVIDEKALERALKKREIAGAGLDVFEFEPAISRTMRALPNVIVTPHIASASENVRNSMAEITAHNVISFLEGKIPPNVVTL